MLFLTCQSPASSWFFHHKFGYNSPRTILARITYYHIGEDRWGSRVADPKVHRARVGVTVAGHPDFPFETHIDIPSLHYVLPSEHFLIQDRGSAVTRKKASHGQAYVFDIFTTTRQARYLAKNEPEYMKVIVY
jgi:hypothetical protein